MKNVKLLNNFNTNLKDFFKLVFKYSLLFLIIIIFICFIFFKHEKGFINVGDGMHQHYPNLINFRRLLLEFFKTGSFNIFTWNVGLGFDLFSNFAYYVFGDPISYFSVFFSESSMANFFNIAAIIRLYFVGIAFILYAKYKKIGDFYSLIGSVIYTFCFYALFSFIRHPYFTNAMILFPLFMIGVEKIIVENKKIFFIIIVFLNYISSFYFGYMMSLVVAIYGILLAINKYSREGVRKIISVLVKTLGCALLGVLMSSFILIPTIRQFLLSARSSEDIQIAYSLNYYRNLFISLIGYSSSNWTILQVNPLALLCIPLLIKYFKENKEIIILLFVLIIPLVIPEIGSVFSGFSYPNERWSFIIPFLLTFLSINILDKHDNEFKKLLPLIIFVGSLYFYLFFNFSYELNLFIVFLVVCFFLYLFIIFIKKFLDRILKKFQLYKLFITGLVIFSLFGTIYCVYVSGLKYLNDYIGYDEHNIILKTNNYSFSDFESGIDYINDLDKGFYRISREPMGLFNISMLHDFKSINGYFSINPKEMNELGYDLDSFYYRTNMELKDFDYRTKILSLLSTKYFLSENTYYVPYGYEFVEKVDKNYIYVNKYFVPFASFYNSYIDVDTYDEMESLEKENSLLNSVVLEENDIDTSYVNKNENILEEVKVSKVDFESSKELSDNSFNILYENEKQLTLNIDSDLVGEYYLVINNLEFTPLNKSELIDLSLIKNKNKTRLYYEEYYKYFEPNPNFSLTIESNDISAKKDYSYNNAYSYDTGSIVFNMSYYDGYHGTVDLNFSRIGGYKFDSMEIVVVDFDDYERQINNLNKSNFVIDKVSSGYMKGTVDVLENGVLQFSTFYSDGWEIYIDGKKIDTLKVNKYFLGTYIEAGSHDVVLKYKTPYLNVGFILSIVAFVIFFVIFMLEKRKSELNEKR